MLCLYSVCGVYAESRPSLNASPNLAVSNVTQNSAHVVWESVPDATRYELSYGTDPKAANRNTLFVSGLASNLGNLVPNTIYRVKVRAIVAGQASVWSRIAEFSTQIPAMVDLTADDVRGNNIHLTWSGKYSDLPDVGYEISYGTDPDASSEGTRSTDKTFITLQNLSPETRYNIKMRVRNLKEVGPWSTPISCTTLAFGPDLSPRGLTIRNGDRAEIVVTWEQVPHATAYDLGYGTDAQAENMGIMPLEQTNFALHLSPNSRYYFKVRSVSNGATGPWCTVQSVLTLPSRPRGLNVSAITANQATIAWQSLSGNQISRYYHFSWGTNPAGTNAGVTTTTNASYNLNGLAPNQSYAVRVQTMNESGASDWSEPLSFTTLPAGFTRLEIMDIQHTSAKVKWPPLAQAAGYEVAFSQDRDGYYQILEDIKQSPAELKNLRPETTYYVKVRPILTQDRHAGAWSNVTAFSTFAVPPMLENLTLIECGGSFVRVSWTAAEKISTYEALISQDDLAEEGSSKIFNQPEARLSNLDGNTHYYIKIRARNLGGPGPWSAILGCITLPNAAPRPLTINNLTATEAFLSWEFVPGGVQAHYQLRYAPQDGAWRIISNFNGRTLNLTKLEPDQDYRVQIRGQNPSGFGPWTEESSFKTLPLPPTVAPAGLIAKDVDDVSAMIIWQPLLTSLTGYQISMGSDSDASNRWVENTKKTFFAIKGLTPETTFFVKVRGVASAGEGPWSETIVITTRPSPPITAPVNARITEVGKESIIFQWDKSQEAASYELSIGTDPQGENHGDPVSATYAPYIFTKLTPGQTYRVKVRSVNRGGAGPWSQALEAITSKE